MVSLTFSPKALCDNGISAEAKKPYSPSSPSCTLVISNVHQYTDTLASEVNSNVNWTSASVVTPSTASASNKSSIETKLDDLTNKLLDEAKELDGLLKAKHAAGSNQNNNPDSTIHSVMKRVIAARGLTKTTTPEAAASLYLFKKLIFEPPYRTSMTN